MQASGSLFHWQVMKLRKALTITGLFFIILIVLGELLLPPVVESALENRLSQKFSTPHVEVELSASPRLKLLLGRPSPVAGTLRRFDALTHEWQALRLPADPDCPVCGRTNPALKD